MILLGADPLSRFLNAAAAHPFAWGEFDCLLWLADWIAAARGLDPARDLRGSYGSMIAAARIVTGAGGMVRLVDSRLAPLGIPRARQAARGDIAIAAIGGAGGEHFGNEAGAIVLGGTVALISQAGLILPRWNDAPIKAAWRVLD